MMIIFFLFYCFNCSGVYTLSITYPSLTKFVDMWPPHPYTGAPQNSRHEVWSTWLYRMCLYAVALQLPFTGTELSRPNLLQHDNSPVHVSSMKTCFAMVKVDQLECPAQRPDLDLSERLWDLLECRLGARSLRLTSLHDRNYVFSEKQSLL